MAGTERMTVAEARALLGADLGQGGRAGGRVARGQKQAGVMNTWEQAYEDEVLRPALLAGDILWYGYELIKLRLAKATFLDVDFWVMLKNGELEIREVKGHWEEDARVKFKVAADRFPFRFIAVTRIAKKAGGGWSQEVFE